MEWTKLRDGRARLFGGRFGDMAQHCAAEFLELLFDRWHTVEGRRTRRGWCEAGPFLGHRLGTVRTCGCGTAVAKDDGWGGLLLVGLPRRREPVTLRALMEADMNAEPLTGVRCDECKRKTEQERTMSITEIRRSIIIGFKRLPHGEAKICTPVRFPKQGRLPMNPNGPVVQLKAVCVHTGRSGDAHYFVFLRKTSGWWRADGDAVERVPEEVVLASQATLLLYEVVAT